MTALTPEARAAWGAVRVLAKGLGTSTGAWQNLEDAIHALLSADAGAAGEAERELKPIPGFAFPPPGLVDAIKRVEHQERPPAPARRDEELANLLRRHRVAVLRPGPVDLSNAETTEYVEEKIFALFARRVAEAEGVTVGNGQVGKDQWGEVHFSHHGILGSVLAKGETVPVRLVRAAPTLPEGAQ